MHCSSFSRLQTVSVSEERGRPSGWPLPFVLRAAALRVLGTHLANSALWGKLIGRAPAFYLDLMESHIDNKEQHCCLGQ